MLFLRVFTSFLFSISILFGSINFVKDAKVVKGELRLEFSNKYNINTIKGFILVKPYRRVFDLTNTRLSDLKLSKKLPRAIKIAQYKPNTVRIVIANSRPYSCTPYRPFLSHRFFHVPLPKNSLGLPATRYKNTSKKRSKVKKKKSPIRREVVVIDAGHGGRDAGAYVGGKKEKILVLQIAKKVERELRKKGYKVYLTRRKDVFLKLHQRTKIADKRDAAIFISIHANSVAKKRRHKIHGVETFFLKKSRDARSQRIAQRENKSVLRGTTKLSRNVIIDSVLSGPKIVQSNKLAIDIQKRIITNLRKRYKNIRDGGVRHAPFWVLVGASRPSVLVEVGYISHPMERKRLFSSRYQQHIARGIAEGIDMYLSNRKKEIDF